MIPVDLSARNLKLTEGLKNHVLHRIGKLDKYSLKIESVHVILQVVKSRHHVELVAQGKGFRMTATQESHDMYAAFDMALSNIQMQLNRYHDKIKHHHQPPNDSITP